MICFRRGVRPGRPYKHRSCNGAALSLCRCPTTCARLEPSYYRLFKPLSDVWGGVGEGTDFASISGGCVRAHTGSPRFNLTRPSATPERICLRLAAYLAPRVVVVLLGLMTAAVALG